MRNRNRFPAAILAGVVLAGLALVGCSETKSTPLAPAPVVDEGLLGAWVAVGHDAASGITTYERVAVLDGDRIGYAFLDGGELLHRSPGWCGTPPLSYHNQPGRWTTVAADRIDLLFEDWPFDSRVELVAVDETALLLRRVETE